jgi:HEPN domain-containing protein
MPRKDSTVPDDWFSRAREDLVAASTLLAQGDVPNVVGHLLHQAAEKGLKAYLLGKRQAIRRVHDLDVLLDEAARFHPGLERHRQLCVRATEFYVDVKYPGVWPEPLGEDELEQLLGQTEALLTDLETTLRS